MCKVPLVGVADAKDLYDKLSQDTSFGSQKSLAFSMASMRQSLRRPNASFRWTATETLFVDAGTKLMDCAALCQTLLSGKWSIEFKAGFTKQSSKGKKASKVGDAEPGDELPGRVPAKI